LPGKAPVFAFVTKVDKGSETINYFLLFDEIVNTERIVEDEKGAVKKRLCLQRQRDSSKSAGQVEI